MSIFDQQELNIHRNRCMEVVQIPMADIDKLLTEDNIGNNNVIAVLEVLKQRYTTYVSKPLHLQLRDGDITPEEYQIIRLQIFKGE